MVAAHCVRGLLTISVVAVITLAAWVIVPLAWGWEAYTVSTGSMSPLVQPGDVIVTAPYDAASDAELGTVVVLAPPPEGKDPITHRIVEHLPDGRYRTKGDANLQPDSRLVTADQILGEVRIVVPLAGQVQMNLGRGALIAGGLLLLLSLLHRRRRRHRGIGEGGGPPPDASRTLIERVTPTVAVCCVVLSATTLGTAWSITRANWTGTTSTAQQRWTTSDFYYQAIIASGPVSYWRLGGASTTLAVDEIATTNATMTLAGTPAVLRPGALHGDPDRSTHFTRSPITYGVVSNAAHSLAGEMTVAAWTNATAVTSTNWRLVFKGNSTNLNYLLSWSTTGTDMRFLVDLVTTSRRTATATYPTTGGWHFIVGVYDNTAARLYIDGVPQGVSLPASGALYTSAAGLTISENNAASAMLGDVDEVALWSKALSPTEISHLYAIGKP